MGNGKILVLVEGEKADVKLMEKLLTVYGIKSIHQIISYKTNIYSLYNSMFKHHDDYDSLDLLQTLKETEKDARQRKILSERYTDILLIFDLDPQDPQFAVEKILKMSEYFVESSDMGKLYLNYPMVEAFYHMKSIPDEDYNNYFVTMEELKAKSYKKKVHDMCRDGDTSKFAKDKMECSIVIKQNIEKARLLINKSHKTMEFPDLNEVLNMQISLLKECSQISVLSTCVFYIVDYDSKLIP